ncbi:GH3 domain-containing protein isoform X1 [Danio aesculapii]|uniref:GH3 domain-containing protein isoform X1 n=1 Tax=Danio aesculapii TaxID=1142201 RepID=UPI0024C014E0|nr:GH3 domain-containing protein isoform X1 [Danio aesculapii]
MMLTHGFWIILPICIALLAVTVTRAPAGLLLLLCLCIMALLWKIKIKNRSLLSLLTQCVAMKSVGWLGNRQRNRLEKDTQEIHRVQEETLLKRLRKHSDTVYGKLYEFSSIKDTETFKHRHPVTNYDHYEKFVDRVAKGEQKVLISENPLILAMTSGTSGSSRMLLSTKDTNTDFFLQGVTVCLDAMRRAFPATECLQKTLKLFYSPLIRQSEAGIPIGPNSSTPASSRYMLYLYTTPALVYQVLNERDALYLHLLFGLKDRNLGMLESNFCSTIFYAFRALEEHWRDLVMDVEVGMISSALNLKADVRCGLEKLMKPDPERAAELTAQFEEGFERIALRLWPQLHLVLAVDSGSNQIYGEMLRQHYCKDVPFYSPFYAATEGLIGVNLWPLQESRQYLLCPRSMFCEFIPEEDLESEQPKTLLMEQLKEGHSYELLVTNASGLFRYPIGDIVKVVGFHNQCPKVEFQYRRGQMLNVRGEKVSELLFLGALKRAVMQWPGARLIDYSCVESGILGNASGIAQPHYLVFVELKGLRNLSEEQRYKLDQSLQEDSSIYKSYRIKGSIGPMRVQLVRNGSFEELKDHMVAFSSVSSSTFKMQRVIRRKEFADFLLQRAL